MKSLPIDLHLEVSTLKNFINSQLETRNPNLLYGKDYYEIFKRVVIDAEVKPFLTFPKDESENNYYEKYVRQSKEEFEKLIPDFFEHEGEFYDLDRVQYVYNEYTRPDDFEKLFIVKLLELKSKGFSVDEFLAFQKHDNFYGQKEYIDSFLYRLIANDSNCYLLEDLCQVLRDWIGSQELAILEKFSKDVHESKVKLTSIGKIVSQENWDKEVESLLGKELESQWTTAEILHYFSFLYKEKSENGDPYLTKEQVDKIFENGFRIPDKPITPLFKPNCSKRYPLKNITFAINEFYSKSYSHFKDKRAYFTFFGSFIEGYTKYLISPEEYKNFSSNTSNSLASRTRINWDLYLPPRKFFKKPKN